MKGRIYIGTSGWMYKAWHKKFYPPKTKNFLAYYSTKLKTVEINNTFYRLPRADIFSKWKREVPSDFLFSVKLWQQITHRKRLKDAKFLCNLFLERSKRLGNKHGPLLIQLPPYLPFDALKLDSFLSDLRQEAKKIKFKKLRLAVEPRHFSWFTEESVDEIYKIFKKYEVSPVIAISSKFTSLYPNSPTADFIYFRLHGPEEFAASRYGRKLLAPWAKKMKKWSEKGLDVFVYFNNDVHGYAVDDAAVLINLTKHR